MTGAFSAVGNKPVGRYFHFGYGYSVSILFKHSSGRKFKSKLFVKSDGPLARADPNGFCASRKGSVAQHPHYKVAVLGAPLLLIDAYKSDLTIGSAHYSAPCSNRFSIAVKGRNMHCNTVELIENRLLRLSEFIAKNPSSERKHLA